MKFNKFEIGLLSTNIFLSVLLFIMGNDMSSIAVLSVISSISNITCVILVAKRSIWNYVPGLIGTLTYGILSYLSGNTGEWMLNLIFYVPMQFIGWFVWSKSLSSLSDEVQSKYLNKKQWLITILSLVIGIYLYGSLMSLDFTQTLLYGKVFDHPIYKYYIDSFTTVASITAQILMLKKYREQWLVWISVNVFTIVLWGITTNPIMILQWTCMLINSIYGFIKWKQVGEIK